MSSEIHLPLNDFCLYSLAVYRAGGAMANDFANNVGEILVDLDKTRVDIPQGHQITFTSTPVRITRVGATLHLKIFQVKPNKDLQQ